MLGVYIKDRSLLSVSFVDLVAGIADQAALILERLAIGQVAEEGRVRIEREKLRNMLLSSVSHDLKTPLASIIGSLSVLSSLGPRLQKEQRDELITTALDEAQRLDSFITNILDMTRIESGQIELKQEWLDPAELASAVCRRLKHRLRNRTVEITVPSPAAEVRSDYLIALQALQNLIDNATKYTVADSNIQVMFRAENNNFICEVRDFGQGIPDAHIDKIFDKYARISQRDNKVAGTGLGLAIVRAVMQVQGGKVTVANHPDGGAVFTLIWPEWRLQPAAFEVDEKRGNENFAQSKDAKEVA